MNRHGVVAMVILLVACGPPATDASEPTEVVEEVPGPAEPGPDPTRVKVVTDDGKVFERIVETPLGSLDRPMSFDDCAAKFQDCASSRTSVFLMAFSVKLSKPIRLPTMADATPQGMLN